jgi:hypothetical protein
VIAKPCIDERVAINVTRRRKVFLAGAAVTRNQASSSGLSVGLESASLPHADTLLSDSAAELRECQRAERDDEGGKQFLVHITFMV